jgi:hypothetical protein
VCIASARGGKWHRHDGCFEIITWTEASIVAAPLELADVT